MTNTMSQKTAREGLGNPELFEGGVFVTKNGVAELFVQTAAERQAELAERARERQINALLKLVMKGKHDIANDRKMSPEEAKQRLRDARR
ncbi:MULTISPECIES: hypothetical protein [Brenneria]|uniref:Prevent-host-death protein n=2 Tax=Brenneria TaxID=71655 RepID=A0A2U1UVM9_9GAMM|nr:MULTISPECIES: hypothetical protein [Brenneria]EHD20162.1 hypothetical protein BrE312_0718 [Brenneria sp. EniD312]MCL2894069.1 hypothetical protein [Brenneria tiliae]MCL2898943.1 hypothetical protein [Brenneria tiliae]MCL2903120.1 hypothetical protein [Brenneria tiliae]PWC25744.1 hypothetical protein DDT54_03495 [Brenneria nigrifluens DSM 30175 = ATCC 13028]